MPTVFGKQKSSMWLGPVPVCVRCQFSGVGLSGIPPSRTVISSSRGSSKPWAPRSPGSSGMYAIYRRSPPPAWPFASRASTRRAKSSVGPGVMSHGKFPPEVPSPSKFALAFLGRRISIGLPWTSLSSWNRLEEDDLNLPNPIPGGWVSRTEGDV